MKDEVRLESLEVKVSYQDDTLRQLNDVVVRQQQQIDTLEQLTQQLLGRVSALSAMGDDESMSAFSVTDERPPHY